MPTFKYTARDSKGNLITDNREQAERQLLVKELRSQGIFPITIEEVKSKLPKKNFVFFRSKKKEVFLFTRNLSNLLNSGLLLSKALELLANQSKNLKIKETITQIIEEVSSGGYFWEALSRHPGLFSNSYVSMIKAGETGGNLEKVIDNLSKYTQESNEMRSEALSMLIYPIILLIVGLGTMIFLMMKVVPNMLFVFDNLEQALPLSTRILIALSNFTTDYFWILFILFALILLIGRRFYRSKSARSSWDAFLLKVPLVNDFLKKSYFVRFSQITGLMLSNGVNLIDTLDISKGIIDNVFVNKKLAQVRDDVASGSSLSLSLTKSDVFSSFMIEAVAVGEETGRLEESLLKSAKIYEQEIRQESKRLLSLLEPVIIFSLALAVGFLVMAILLPIFQMNLQIN